MVVTLARNSHVYAYGKYTVLLPFCETYSCNDNVLEALRYDSEDGVEQSDYAVYQSRGWIQF